MIDITYILLGILAVVVGIIVWKVVPAIKASAPAEVFSFLRLVCRFAVYSIEAEMGSGNGEAKLEAALTKAENLLKKYSVTFDVETVKSTILEYWYELNTEQIALGIKDVVTVEDYDTDIDQWPTDQIISFLAGNGFGLPSVLPDDPDERRKVLLDYCDEVFKE